jgi:hypothetical protein
VNGGRQYSSRLQPGVCEQAAAERPEQMDAVE